MFRSISSISFSGQLEDKIEAAAKAGFDGIEIFREDIIGFEGAPEDIPAFAAEAGVKIVSLQSLRDFEGLSGAARTEAFARARRFLDLAARIGAPMLIVCANTRVQSDPAHAARDLRELAVLAAEKGLRLGFEALATSAHVNTVSKAWEVVRAVDADNLGLVLGTVHLFAMETAPEVVNEIAVDKIALVHLADAPTTKIDRAALTQSFRLFPGQGSLPLGGIYAGLSARGYTGPMSIEIFNDQIRSLPASQIAADGMRAFHLLDEMAREGATPHSDLVAPVFVEFTAQPSDRGEIEGLLSALGFACTHRTGEVALWRNGAAAVMVNAERGGLAHAIYLLQGLSVSGLCFEADDLDTLDRRIGLFHGERLSGTNEAPYDLPLLRGPGGSAFYLSTGGLESVPGLAQFEATGAAPGQGLARIDHFAQALQPNLFLSGMMFYRASFDLRSEGVRDVLDPHGTVHSRTMTNDSGAVRLSLNASFGASTTTQRFLAHSGFAPWHHVAFATDDILAFADRLDPADVLPIPANYYEDLALRFDLAPEIIETLKARDILYDRDAGGEYFQLYTRSVNGFFFEIVERRGYAGMGAANAGVRMLAQSREAETANALELM